MVMKCSWRADLNGGPFAEDGPGLEHFVPINHPSSPASTKYYFKVHLCFEPFLFIYLTLHF